MELISLKKRFQLLFILFTACFHPLLAQRTLGLLHYSEDAFPGYTLFAPAFSRDAFLIDNCGFLVKKWSFSQFPLDTELLPDGRLLRTSRVSGNFTGGGAGGRLDLYDWDGKLLWNVVIADEKMHQHHEAQFLPNGNLLLVVWYRYSKEEALQKGFLPDKLTEEGIWSDRILEIKLLADNDYEIVWQWDFWDHTIQDKKANLPNFGTISEHPELLDVNFYEDPGANPAEWLHVNSLDYNERLDQILISSKFHNEIYIIDHSTTTEEAKGHSGGKYGRGGDFLYRWGNPRSYGRGTTDQHWLYGQHDVQWIADSLPGGGNMLLFNNGSNRIGEVYSTVDEVVLPDNDSGVYPLNTGERYAPELPSWMYVAAPRTSFYSSRISGAQRLANGNTLMCEGNKGRFTEVDTKGNIVWMYQNPVNTQGPGTQGASPANLDVFRVDRFGNEYPAFTGKSLMPMQPVELGNINYDCKKLSSVDEEWDTEIAFYPNPADEFIIIKANGYFQISSMFGTNVISGNTKVSEAIDVSGLPAGMYIFYLQEISGKRPRYFSFHKN